MSKSKVVDLSDEEIIALSETDEWVPVGDLEERRRFWREAARNMIEGKRQRISISIPERDLARLKAKALEMGMPYQTLINSILHKYVS
ncbi:DNA-binding protein [Neorhizobium sp. Rsf11]|uniref:DNA-binding protein n=2 Tax=Neorhizobium TaxID=1525371 RepID=A0ABV0M2P8_9HYPH|nr:DNA-binding protein [Neorhizobium petrolearium]MCC2610224.1 DNA-binding protein [Neorhizobium petrolearium]WGI70383.1 DNA-binding protein [Neorhizobium petrolearium]